VYPLSHRLAYSRDFAQLPDTRVLYPASATEVSKQSLNLLRPKPINPF
jgi:hypothetical protein